MLAFSIDYYGIIFRATQFVELFCTYFILAADILGTLVQWAQQEREAWWKEAYKDIINGTISAVRYTIVQSTTEYPKVWRVFERI